VTANFPQYRAREDALSTIEERVNGCMERSMNGRPLPSNSKEMKAILAYMHFLSRGIPVGAKIEGSATPDVTPPLRHANLAAGETVYKMQCGVCHGQDGAGQRVGQKGDAQGYRVPPLWGPDSFNTGASMSRLLVAMRFIKHNMPLGVNHTSSVLSDDQAFDVAAYMISKPRPEKPHIENDFPARWNKPVDAAFPPYVDDAPADQHKYGPFQPLVELEKRRAAEQRFKESDKK
jgi:thiosulfate dehydrogenase